MYLCSDYCDLCIDKCTSYITHLVYYNRMRILYSKTIRIIAVLQWCVSVLLFCGLNKHFPTYEVIYFVSANCLHYNNKIQFKVTLEGKQRTDFSFDTQTNTHMEWLRQKFKTA